MTTYRGAMVVVMFLGLSAPAWAQIDTGVPSGYGSGSYSDAHTKAAKAYRQGLKYRQRAEKASEAAEREELYKKALEKFYESAQWVENFDARLAMGEVHLALRDLLEEPAEKTSQKAQAFQACHIAKYLKPKNEKAKACYAAAGGETQEASKPE